ncbi:hypothetical protein [Woeseia oceani]|uniref:hypothetical protein n=1 Tax=Woeseia oceani TaxID=1548547 RepID=UPI000AB8FD79|nr:hypothetical protein [Woeseia oceani]
MAPVTIDARFCGPENSGNGGYSAGRLASGMAGSVEVTLRKPPPLQVPLTVRVEADGSRGMYCGVALVASARPAPVVVRDLAVPSFSAAAEAATRTFPDHLHQVPGCFVCGPDRLPGEGLRLHPGPLDAADVEWQGPVACTWVPTADLGDQNSVVRSEFVWSALDCPTAYACASMAGMRLLLLGRQTVEILRLPTVGQRCIVVAQRGAHEGRKFFADACLYSEHGEVMARCNALWISVSQEVLQGASRKAG